MPRLSVSIPDELIARLEPIKDRINVSQVCREALERRIASFERASQQPDENVDMEGLIDRLREERAVVEGKFEGLGRRNAATWLGTTGYLELKSVAEDRNSLNMHGYRLPRSAFETMKKDMDQANLSFDGVHAISYKTAWLDYVRAIWDEVAIRLDVGVDGRAPVEAAVAEDTSNLPADENEE